MSALMLPLTSPVKRSRFIAVDIETKDGETQKGGFTRPFLVGIYDGEKFVSERGPLCILKALGKHLLTKKNMGAVFYAHNGGGFDWLHFLPVIEELGYHYEILTVASSIQMLTVKRSSRSKEKGWRFLDSMKLLPMSLDKAAKAFQVETLKGEIDYDTNEDDPRWLEYLERDCVALYQVLTKAHDLVEIRLRGEVGITAASTAMRTFRRAHMVAPIQRHKEHHPLFRECYYGGRVERFREHAEGLHYFDINSSYPNAMLEPMPVGDLVEHYGTPTESLKAGTVGFARARVTVPESTRIPVLPVRHPVSGKLVFPTGTFEGSWTAIELLTAQAQGAIIEWKESVWIRAHPVLAPIVRELYEYRDTARPDYDEGLATLAKILLNSLYGKFGMATKREKIIVLREGDDIPIGGRPADPLDPDCGVWYVEEETDAPYVAPQIAAQVTAIARLTLHKYLTLADEKGVLAYCDTDSILTTADLSEFVSSKLGALKDEGKGKTFRGVFLQPKVYMLTCEQDDSVKLTMKGYRPSRDWSAARKAEFFSTVKAGGVVSYESLEKIGALAKAGFSRGPQMRVVARSLKTIDTKRQFYSDGSSRPVHFSLDVALAAE